MHATDVHGSTGKTGRPLLFAATGFVLLAATVAVALLLHPPLLGWVGFALVCAIVFGLATFAAVVFPRLRVSAQRPAEPPDSEKRLLVVADEHCGSPGLWKSIEAARLAGAVAVHLVVPVRVSHLHYVTNDEASESRAAEDRAGLAVELLRQQRISVTGGAGSDDPLESMTDALGSFPATHVLLATSTAQDSYWLEHDLLAKARALTSLEVTQVVVPPNAPTQSDGTQQAARAGTSPSGTARISAIATETRSESCAPDIALGGDEVSQRDESDLYHHQLNYVPPASESGRRLARR